jgi:hypothetical protein
MFSLSPSVVSINFSDFAAHHLSAASEASLKDHDAVADEYRLRAEQLQADLRRDVDAATASFRVAEAEVCFSNYYYLHFIYIFRVPPPRLQWRLCELTKARR